ncbi:ATP-binding protein [Amycolatopsis sp. CA-128772]|uniref:ATP-binding protein n=1 Tax=Amycolatopsis sp. CA-128772 TaxID=2073159 RepID=UPI000CD2C2E9|nr:ATP-binding protein [Amycolatopsis sp. CA-128772]
MTTDSRDPLPDAPAADCDGDVADLHRRGLEATPHQLAGLRRQVGEWARRAGLAVGRVPDLVLAVYEAMANVVVHAYAGHAGLLDLSARHHGHRLTVTVADRGQWEPARVRGLLHGRGLPLIRTLADEVSLISSPDGTTVEMTWDCRAAN